MRHGEQDTIIDGNVDERKSAALVAAHLTFPTDVRRVDCFADARAILRDPASRQGGAGAEHVDVGNPEHVPVFYLDGESHRKRRAAIMNLFTPKAITTRHAKVMEDMTDQLLTRFRAKGEGQLDQISFELAVAVAAEIVGLTQNPPHRMAPRIDRLLRSTLSGQGLWAKLASLVHGFRFYVADVRPAVAARRKQRRDDIISQTLDKGYSDRAIMIECMTYATAGMVTTREFITMVAWHLFDRPDLRQHFLDSDEAGQFALLEEILRLEPIAALIQRRVGDGETMAAIDIRAANADPAIVGGCPHRIDPGRARRQGQNGGYMSFGDGPHTCPGRQVALHETRIFLNRLFRVPGLRLLRTPDLGWNPMLMGYELRNARIGCDR